MPQIIKEYDFGYTEICKNIVKPTIIVIYKFYMFDFKDF